MVSFTEELQDGPVCILLHGAIQDCYGVSLGVFLCDSRV